MQIHSLRQIQLGLNAATQLSPSSSLLLIDKLLALIDPLLENLQSLKELLTSTVNYQPGDNLGYILGWILQIQNDLPTLTCSLANSPGATSSTNSDNHTAAGACRITTGIALENLVSSMVILVSQIDANLAPPL